MSDKKKLQSFLSDLLKLGCVKGFKYFATHLRGREEMICSIINEPSVPILLSSTNSPASSFALQKEESFPKEPGLIMMSQKQQRSFRQVLANFSKLKTVLADISNGLSGYGFINVGLPPASPSESEEDVDENCTMFLIAGYSRYNCPYVWVRSNHERLVQLSSEDTAEKDYPLLLKSTSEWQEKDVKVWDVLAELIQICTSPSPPNPFAVDFDYFDALHLPERALASGAMAAFLQRIVASAPHSYNKKVQSDLLKISQCHFNAVSELLLEGAIQPVSPETQPPQHKETVSPLRSQQTSGQMSSETMQQHHCNTSDQWKFR